MERNAILISDMGQLSNATYKEYGVSIKKGYTLNDGTILEGDILSLNNSYTVIDYTDTPSNMQALLLEKNNSAGNPTGEYIIAFRGTQELFDWGVDGIIGLANYNPQFNDAKAFVQEMMTAHNISAGNLTLTGHSLGGILTQSVGAVLGIKGYAFNPYGTERLLTMWQNYSGTFAEALLNAGIYQVLNAFGLDSSYADFARENILNVSYNDFGTLNGDILSNFASALGSDHLGGYLPIITIDLSGTSLSLFFRLKLIFLLSKKANLNLKTKFQGDAIYRFRSDKFNKTEKDIFMKSKNKKEVN